MYGEASPFYIASRHACQRIAKDLPRAKIIILLREPVARGVLIHLSLHPNQNVFSDSCHYQFAAYSEYQMKKRRVESQNGFIQLVSDNANDVYDCMKQFDEVVYAFLIAFGAHYRDMFLEERSCQLHAATTVSAGGCYRA
jgi:hypothetical protein